MRIVPVSLNQPSAFHEALLPQGCFPPTGPPPSWPRSGPCYTRVGKRWPRSSPAPVLYWSTPHPSVDILSVSAFRASGRVERLGQRPYGLQSLQYSPSGFLQKLCQPSVLHSCRAGLYFSMALPAPRPPPWGFKSYLCRFVPRLPPPTHTEGPPT